MSKWQGKASEATLQLSVPSAKLTRCSPRSDGSPRSAPRANRCRTSPAPTRRPRGELADVVAERGALLRTLGAREHAGRDRKPPPSTLAGRRSDRETQTALAGLSRRASNSSVEVTVLANGHAAGEGLTLHRGLHDAGRVLTVALICLLIGLAGLVPAPADPGSPPRRVQARPPSHARARAALTPMNTRRSVCCPAMATGCFISTGS